MSLGFSKKKNYQNYLIQEERVLVRAVIITYGEAKGSEWQCSVAADR